MRDIFLSYKISRNYHKIWVCGEKDVQHRQAQEEHQQQHQHRHQHPKAEQTSWLFAFGPEKTTRARFFVMVAELLQIQP
jgi:CDP-glycerol glycerophosphotransferase (TagB/SpsB family)